MTPFLAELKWFARSGLAARTSVFRSTMRSDGTDAKAELVGKQLVAHISWCLEDKLEI